MTPQNEHGARDPHVVYSGRGDSEARCTMMLATARDLPPAHRDREAA